jgi:hypothetical protein
MNIAENVIILWGQVYQHKKIMLTIGLSKPAKFKNFGSFFNTPPIEGLSFMDKIIKRLEVIRVMINAEQFVFLRYRRRVTHGII